MGGEASGGTDNLGGGDNAAGAGDNGVGGVGGDAGGPSAGGMAGGTAGNGAEAGAPGAAGAGGEAGAGGFEQPTVCPEPPAAGSLSAVLIDDLEDRDNALARMGGRSGRWFTFLDAYGSTIEPPPDVSGLNPLMPGITNCHAGAACVIVSGTTLATDSGNAVFPYAGVGFDFSNAMKSCRYDARAYTGITLWARGNTTARVKLATSATTPVVDGGTCVTNCGDAHGRSIVLGAAWSEVTLPFATITQEGWGTVAAFDEATLLHLQVLFPASVDFEAALDDISFY